MIDTHAHLSNFNCIEKIVCRAKKAGVDGVVAVSADLGSSSSTMQTAKAYHQFVHPAIGIHPTEWTAEARLALQYIEQQIEQCVAVGEIGLDYWEKKARKDGSVRKGQRELYSKQLQIANEHCKPVSVHSRGSWQDALKLAVHNGPDRIVFHWFSGPENLLKQILDEGYLISATPAAEFSKHHQDALLKTPLEKILVETDAPVFLRNRGRESEPSDLLITINALAKLKETSKEEIISITSKNAEKFFRLR